MVIEERLTPNDKVRVLYDALSLITRRSWTNSARSSSGACPWHGEPSIMGLANYAVCGARYGGAGLGTSPRPSTSTVLWPRVARSHSIQISLLTSEIKYNNIIMNQIQ